MHVAKAILSLQHIFFVNGIKISLKYAAFPCVPPFIFEAEAPLFAVSLALTVAVYSVPSLGANAVFIWLPAVKHVAKAKKKKPWRRGREGQKRSHSAKRLTGRQSAVLQTSHPSPLFFCQSFYWLACPDSKRRQLFNFTQSCIIKKNKQNMWLSEML